MTIKQQQQTGKKIAEILMLKPLKKYNLVKYNTAWGYKTELGLYQTVKTIIKTND